MANTPNVSAPTPEEVAAVRAHGDYTAVLHTNKGDITLRLAGAEVPLHVTNFVKLAQAGFYSNVKFHRVVPNFVIQTGDPTGTGMGGPGYKINFEKSPLKHIKGALGMARSQDVNSAGSQFYITLEATPFLDEGYVVFGETISGMDVVSHIVEGDTLQSVDIQ
ncbi:MAG TPA: peptidylprolyl isomerase [Armatimonadota bacterium]|jgi:peptidyl-prolyl cis-trans isomerase B (cyclophilin B)